MVIIFRIFSEKNVLKYKKVRFWLFYMKVHPLANVELVLGVMQR